GDSQTVFVSVKLPPASWSAVAERSADTAFARTRPVEIKIALVRSKAPSTLRSAGAVQNLAEFVASLKERGSVSRSTLGDRETPKVLGLHWLSTIAAGRRPALRF